MTYKLIEPNASGTGLYFQSGNEDLPMDKLQSFWPLRNATETNSVSPDLLGACPMISTSTAAPVTLRAASNPCGGSLGSFDTGGNACWWESAVSGDAYFGENKSQPWWMSFWFYPRAATTTISIFIARYPGSGDGPYSGWRLYWNNSTNTLNFDSYVNATATTYTATSGNTGTNDAWNFGMIGSDGTDMFVTLNGGTMVEVTHTIVVPSSTASMRFGKYVYAGSNLDGMVCDLSYWINTAANPTATEIAALYNLGNGNTLLGG